MLDTILNIDYYLTALIGGQCHNSFFDAIAPIWRTMSTWFPLYFLVIIIFLIAYKSNSWILIFYVIACVGITDLSSNYLFKKNFKRLRPCRTQLLENQIKPLVPCGSGYSFTSSHAANHTALATAIALILPYKRKYWKPILYIWAFSIGLAQIYVGLHFVSDVIVGSLLGYLVSNLVFSLFKRWISVFKFLKNDFY